MATAPLILAERQRANLLSLPLEIRQEIWELALQAISDDASEEPGHWFRHYVAKFRHRSSGQTLLLGTRSLTNLLCVNHTIHDEATAVTRNRYEVYCAISLDIALEIFYVFFNKVSVSARHQVQSITVMNGLLPWSGQRERDLGDVPATCHLILRELPRLRTITLILNPVHAGDDRIASKDLGDQATVHMRKIEPFREVSEVNVILSTSVCKPESRESDLELCRLIKQRIKDGDWPK